MQRALSFTATVFAIPFRGMSELSVNCALLKGENRSNRTWYCNTCLPIYTISPLSNLIEIATLPFYYLLLIFPVNEISTARFFTDASFSIQMDFILRLIEREWRGTKKNRKKENTLVRKHIRIDRDIVYINFSPIIYIYIYMCIYTRYVIYSEPSDWPVAQPLAQRTPSI